MSGNRLFHTARGYQLLEQEKSQLTPSLEDYMEMICRETLSEGHVTVTQLASRLSVRPPSASKMIARLSSLGFLKYEKYGDILLTEKGEELGKYLLWRHDVVYGFLSLLYPGEKEKIFREAEVMEHGLLRESVERLFLLTGFINSRPELLKELSKELKTSP